MQRERSAIPTTALGLLLLALCVAPAWAEKPEEAWDNLGQLTAGQKVEVIDQDLKTIHGPFVSFSEERISLRQGKREVFIERGNVLRVGALSSSLRVRNALIGAGVGLGLGMVGGVGVLGATGGSDFPGAVLGPAAAVGMGVGAAGGYFSGGYRTIYRGKRIRKK